jgi:flagellar motor switch protein FliN
VSAMSGPHSETSPAALEAEALLDVDMRLSVEIGRTRMPVARAVALESGAIVELDRRHDEPVEVYVNGLRFGSGRLLERDGEWALRIDRIDAAREDVEQASTGDTAPPSPAD